MPGRRAAPRKHERRVANDTGYDAVDYRASTRHTGRPGAYRWRLVVRNQVRRLPDACAHRRRFRQTYNPTEFVQSPSPMVDQGTQLVSWRRLHRQTNLYKRELIASGAPCSATGADSMRLYRETSGARLRRRRISFCRLSHIAVDSVDGDNGKTQCTKILAPW